MRHCVIIATGVDPRNATRWLERLLTSRKRKMTRIRSTTVRTLLGKNHFDLSLKCLKTLQLFSRDPITLVVHEDGTLSEEEIDRVHKILTPVSVVRRAEADEIVASQLKGHPACARFRNEHPLAMKLLDVPLSEANDIAMIDSDVCFFRPFQGLFLPLAEGINAIFMEDFQNGYALHTKHYWPIGPFRIPSRVNTGIVHFRRANYDLEYLEWVLQRHGPQMRLRMQWWMEQTCWALLGGRAGCHLLSTDQFSIAREGHAFPPETIGVHFVGASRHLFDVSYKDPNSDGLNHREPAIARWGRSTPVNGVDLAIRFGCMVVGNKLRKLVPL